MTLSKEVTVFLSIIISVLLTSGCAKDSLDPLIRAHLEKPDWITADDDKYVPSIYLSGRGVSSRLNVAKRQSANDLVKNFDRQLIEGLQKVKNQERDNQQDKDAETVSHEKLPKLLDEKTRNYMLQHIRISETWQDPATLAYHVLSTIDRIQVGDEMLEEIHRMDEQINRILDKAGRQQDVLQRIAFANLAIEKQKERDTLQDIVKVVKPQAGDVNSGWNKQRIQEQIGNWLNEIKIMPIARHKEFNLLEAMKNGVSSAGMTVHFGAKPDYILKGTFNQGQIKWKDGVYSLNGNLKLELLDGEWKGQVRGGASWPIEVSALERDQLPEQLAKAIKQAHQKNLRETLLEFEE